MTAGQEMVAGLLSTLGPLCVRVRADMADEIQFHGSKTVGSGSGGMSLSHVDPCGPSARIDTHRKCIANAFQGLCVARACDACAD